MPFPDYEPEIEIVVSHPWHPSQKFIFTFPKILPQSAIDAEARLLGLEDKDRESKSRLLVIETVAKMSSRAPQGFLGFPELTAGEDLVAAIQKYFDDPGQPELEAIITTAWSGYRAAARPVAYSKSLSSNGARARDAARAAAQADTG